MLRRASRRAASALLFLAGQEEDATVRAGRLQALAFADAGAGRAGLAEGAGKRSWHHHSQDRASRAATLRRPRERASALQRHLPCCSSAAEDGVGDLHPLGIGIVAVGRSPKPRSRPGTNATQRRSRWWNRSCSAGAGPSACGAGSLAILCGCSAIGVELPSAGASGRSASRRLPSPGPGSCRRPCSNRDGWHRAPAPRVLSRRSGCRLASTKRSRSAALVFTPVAFGIQRAGTDP